MKMAKAECKRMSPRRSLSDVKVQPEGRRRGPHFCFSPRMRLASVRAVSNNPVYSFFATRASLAPFFLRIALASIFFYQGAQKAFGWFGGPGWNNTIALWTSADNYGLPYLVAAIFLIGELAVCLALFLGFLTRLAALAVVAIMGGILIFVQDASTFESVEVPILLIATGISLMITGAGSFSMDRAISVNLLPQVG
jgi:putative oxidoreductase